MQYSLLIPRGVRGQRKRLIPTQPIGLEGFIASKITLEPTYEATWAVYPVPIKALLEGPEPAQDGIVVAEPVGWLLGLRTSVIFIQTFFTFF
jgi:hypothetical protein